MEPHKIVTLYYDELSGPLRENWTRAIRELDSEAIHEYRLVIKRLAALFRLLDYVSRGALDQKELRRKFRKAFKTGGKVRDMQVLRQHLSDHAPPGTNTDDLEDHLTSRERKYLLKLVEKREETITSAISETRDLIGAEMEKLSAELFRKLSVSWLEKEMSYMESLLDKIQEPEVFHSFRRHQKETFYMIDFLNDYAGMSIETDLPLEEIKSIAYEIGQWHDLHNLSLFIDDFLDDKKDIPEETAVSIRQLSDKLRGHKEQVFRKLNEQLRRPGAFDLKVNS